jgi:integrase/recombinase XerD
LQVERATVREDPTVRVRAPKKPRRLPKLLSEAQVEALLAAPTSRPRWACAIAPCSKRSTPPACACRNWSDSSSPRCRSTSVVVRVMGKGSKERLVPLGDEAVVWLQRYQKVARPALAADAKSDHVFLTARRTPMTRQAFWALIKRYAIKPASPPRRCRRTCCATHSPRTS